MDLYERFWGDSRTAALMLYLSLIICLVVNAVALVALSLLPTVANGVRRAPCKRAFTSPFLPLPLTPLPLTHHAWHSSSLCCQKTS